MLKQLNGTGLKPLTNTYAPLCRYEIRLPGNRDPRARQLDEDRGTGRPGVRARVHARLARGEAPLLAVARRAGGDDVLPHRLATAAARDDVVHREPVRLTAAVLAGPGVAGEHRLAGDLAAV